MRLAAPGFPVSPDSPHEAAGLLYICSLCQRPSLHLELSSPPIDERQDGFQQIAARLKTLHIGHSLAKQRKIVIFIQEIRKLFGLSVSASSGARLSL